MRKLAVAIVVLIVLAGALFAAALWFVPTEELRARLEREIAASLGRETAVGGLELALFPLPSVRVTGLRIAGESRLVPPLAEIDSLRLRLALWPLLRGRIALASLTLERPRLVVPVDASGRPLLPGAPEASAAGAAAGSAPAPATAAESAGGAALLAIDAFHVRDGSARIGRYRFRSIDLDGALRPAGRAEVEGSFELFEIARFQDVDVEIDGLGAAEWSALASMRVADGDLGGIAQLARLGRGYGGRFDLEIDGFRLVNFAAREGRIRTRLHDLDVQRGLLRADGEGSLEADAAGNWKLDLTDAGIHYVTLEKPRGVPFSLEGPFPEAPARRLSARVVLPGNAIEFAAEYSGGDIPKAKISPTTLALEPLAPLLGRPFGGRIRLAPTELLLGPPPAWSGKATLEEVSYPVGETMVYASGDVTLESPVRLVAPRLRARVADQPLDVALAFSMAGPWIETTLEGADLDVGALASGLLRSRDFSGKAKLRAFARGNIDAEQPVAGLDGNGRIEIAPGRIRGFSLLRQTFGELAALPIAVAALRGKDLSRYEEEEFQSLTADYFVREGKLETENLKLVYRNATAELAGDVGLADGALRLRGRVLLAPEVGGELASGSGAKARVIPIAGIGGTLAAPRLHLDRDAALAIGAALSGSERIKEKLDEKLGPGAGEAVEGVLDLLRGGKEEEAAP